jgi:PhnB protein
MAKAIPDGFHPKTASSFLLYVEDVDAAWKRATAEGAEVLVPLGDQFWGDRWGALADRWGNRWGIATHIEDVPADELRRRATLARVG